MKKKADKFKKIQTNFIITSPGNGKLPLPTVGRCTCSLGYLQATSAALNFAVKI